MNIPLFDSGIERRARVRQSAVDAAAHVSGRDDAAIPSEVRIAREAIASAERELVTERAAAEQAQQVVDIVNISFRAGASTNIEVIDAERRARDADTNVAVAEDALRRARFDLLNALGLVPMSRQLVDRRACLTTFLFLFVAALVGGALNAVAGGGSFIGVPALISSRRRAGGRQRHHHAGDVARVAVERGGVPARNRACAPLAAALGVASLVGGLVGGWLLIRTPDQRFLQLLPWLMLAAAVTFTIGGRVAARLAR